MRGRKQKYQDTGVLNRLVHWRVFLVAFGILMILMLVVMLTQFSTSRTITNLQESSIEATRSVSLNNFLEELVNSYYELDLSVRQVVAGQKPAKVVPELKGQIENLRVQTETWEEMVITQSGSPSIDSLSSLLLLGLGSLENALNEYEQGRRPLTGKPAAKVLITGSAIYDRAMQVRKTLEKSLRESIQRNSELSNRIMMLSLVLSIVGIMAVAILGTVLIRRLNMNNGLVRSLDEARSKAENIAALQDQMVANISHEIRTPVNAIVGFSRLMTETPLSREQQEMTQIIQDASRLLLTLVNDLLDTSKLSDNKLKLNSQPFHFWHAIQETGALFRRMAAEKGLTLHVSLDPRMPEWLMGDPDRLQQIIVNLMQNAIRYTQTGGVQLNIRLLREEEGKYWVELQVIDTGIGIAPEDQQRIFERFEQAEDPIYPVAGGTGLGLHIVKNLVDLHGGNLTLESERGRGSMFTVQLPYAPATKQEKVDVPQRNTAFNQNDSFWAARVMVADDNPVNQLLMRHLLAAHDIVPVVVSNGREVIAYLRKHPDFHLVLMDIQMPELRGDEAARLMRDELKLNIPVVAISAYDEETSRVKTGDWAPDAFINKPIHPDAIERILNDLLPDDARTCIPWVDIPWLQKNFNGDQTFIRQMIGLFASQLIAECRLLEAAIAKKDASEMDRIAHQIISTVGSVSPGSCLLYHLSVLRQLLKEPEPDWMVISLNFQVFSRLSRQAEAAAKALIE